MCRGVTLYENFYSNTRFIKQAPVGKLGIAIIPGRVVFTLKEISASWFSIISLLSCPSYSQMEQTCLTSSMDIDHGLITL